jgi:hypothetical protein
MSEFTPQFPRAVAGTEWRAPLNHPEIEAIAKRLDHLYRNFSLSEAHRAEMIVRYSHLVMADEAIDRLVASVAKFNGGVTADELALGDPGIRPKKPKRGDGSVSDGDDPVRDGIRMSVGFALRLAEWTQRLENIYGVTAWKRFGETVNRDEDGNPLVSPGDDI